jgi:hypothetical protein
MDFDEEKTTGDLKEVSKLANKQIELQKEVEELEKILDAKKKELDSVQKEDLPNLMFSLGLKSFTLETGESVNVKHEVKASIPKANQAEAFSWLAENGGGSLVKNEITTSFKMGEANEADKLMVFLTDEGFRAERKMNVHPQSLVAFIKERLEEGEDVPFDLLGVFTFDKAVIKK